MRVYTFFSDSHKKIFDLFLEHFPYNEHTQLNIKSLPQECLTGSYMEKGWQSTMKKKVEYVLEALNETKEGEWFVHSDCDVLFFEGWDNILQKQRDSLDIILQNDAICLCAGLFFCKSTANTKALWNLVNENLEKFDNDQTALNYFLHHSKLKIGVLPDTYFTYGLIKKNRWTGEDFLFPDILKIKTFHANWTTGIDNKIKLMNKCLEQKYGN